MNDSPNKKPQLSAANLVDLYGDLSGLIRQWADSLGPEAEYDDQRHEERGSNDWGGALRRSTEDSLKTTLSLLTAVGRADLAKDLRQRFDELYALGHGYQERLEALEDQRRVHVDALSARYRDQFGEGSAAYAELWATCRGPERIWTYWGDRNPLETVEQYAEAIDKAFWGEQGGKLKARAQVRQAATDLAEHLDVLAAASAPAQAPADQPGGKRRRGDWPVPRTQPEVARYLSERKAKYDELVPRCLRGDKEAHKEFKRFFGPSAIARALGDGCYGQAVSNTRTYTEQIQPVIQSRPPAGWKPAAQDDAPFADEIANMRRQTMDSE
ncbi:MAG: hypothetical protein JXL80_15995 [Planctomycetes bacterium]|nr:hypothetical protein [Planctomycetota bacterium]